MTPQRILQIAQKMETGCADSQREVDELRSWAWAWDKAAEAWGRNQLQRGKREECEPPCGRVTKAKLSKEGR